MNHMDHLGAWQSAELLEGYRDALNGQPAPGGNRSAFYRHGWLNGRDDRSGKPRASAASIRRELEAIEAQYRSAGCANTRPL